MPRRAAASSFPAVLTTEQATARGVTRGRLRHPSLRPVSRGVRARADAGPLDLAAALLSVGPPGSALSHTTAARLLGLPTPHPWTPAEPLHLTSPGSRCRRPGVVGHRGVRPTTVVAGLPVTTPLATWRDLCADPGWSDEDLVAAADAILLTDPRAALADAAASPGRGALRARRCAALARCGAESPGETRTRLVLVGGGLPEPQLNRRVLAPDGTVVARVDMLWEQARVVEYEGDHHRADKRQWRRDVERTRELEHLGYRVVRVTAADLAGPGPRAALVTLVREALDAGAAPTSS